MGGPALRMQGVDKSYGRHVVLRRLGIEVARGETVALLGANGAGKTTLLRLAATLARAQAGTIEVAGIDTREAPERARGSLSILTQEAPLYPELTPAEHLSWWARVQGVTATDLDASLAAAGLGPFAKVPARSLSRGLRQRVALAMALMPPRPLLLFDEPFNALDATGRTWLESELAARRGQAAIVLAIHDEAQARALCDRTLRLVGGCLEAGP